MIISPNREHSEKETQLRKNLKEVKLEELKGKTFELIRVVEMLCEVCQKPLSTKEKLLRKIQITTNEEYQNLLDRATVHDRAEADLENSKIYFYDHDFPGDIHPECVEKL
jgi:DNA polymerase elongation subunit (family B)